MNIYRDSSNNTIVDGEGERIFNPPGSVTLPHNITIKNFHFTGQSPDECRTIDMMLDDILRVLLEGSLNHKLI